MLNKKTRKYAPRPKKTPKLRHHKATDQGFVVLDGEYIYLGKFGKVETERHYHAIINEYLSNNRTRPVAADDITVVELCLQYQKHAAGYYVNGKQEETSTMSWVREAVRVVVSLYGGEGATEFGPLKLRACREVWVGRGLSRRSVNAYTQQLKQVFRWAASLELIPATVPHALATVPNLRKGRSTARETARVEPVPESDIEAIRVFVNKHVVAVIDLQLLSGARPSELLGLCPQHIDTSGSVWVARIKQHKTAYRDKQRELFFGPRAQAILREFMISRKADQFLFSPREAQAERRRAKASMGRRVGQTATERITSRRVGKRYTSASYRQAIERACDVAGVPKWTPGRLRHNYATTIRAKHGIEMAASILGHSGGGVIEVYAEQNRARAIEIVLDLG